MILEGRIKAVFDEKTFGAKGFRKREMVLTTIDGQYEQNILVEFVQDKCDLLNEVQIGESVRVSIAIRGREWINKEGETKYFNSINGWRIEKVQTQQVGVPSSPQNMPPPMNNDTPNTSASSGEGDDDLPF